MMTFRSKMSLSLRDVFKRFKSHPLETLFKENKMSKYEQEIKGLAIEINQKLNDCTQEIVLALDKYFPELRKIKRNIKEHGDNYSLDNRIFMLLYIELLKSGYFAQ